MISYYQHNLCCIQVYYLKWMSFLLCNVPNLLPKLALKYVFSDLYCKVIIMYVCFHHRLHHIQYRGKLLWFSFLFSLFRFYDKRVLTSEPHLLFAPKCNVTMTNGKLFHCFKSSFWWWFQKLIPMNYFIPVFHRNRNLCWSEQVGLMMNSPWASLNIFSF